MVARPAGSNEMTSWLALPMPAVSSRTCESSTVKVLLDSCVWGGSIVALQSAGHDVEWAGNWPSIRRRGDPQPSRTDHRATRERISGRAGAGVRGGAQALQVPRRSTRARMTRELKSGSETSLSIRTADGRDAARFGSSESLDLEHPAAAGAPLVSFRLTTAELPGLIESPNTPWVSARITDKGLRAPPPLWAGRCSAKCCRYRARPIRWIPNRARDCPR